MALRSPARRAAGAVLVALLAALALAPASWAARPLHLGFFDGIYTSADPAERDLWLDRTVAVNAPQAPPDLGHRAVRRLPARRPCKRAARAFRFPFVAKRSTRRRHRVWGRSPVAGRLRIERRTGTRWQTVRTARVRRGGTFLPGVSRKRMGERLRARVGDTTSLTWVSR